MQYAIRLLPQLTREDEFDCHLEPLDGPTMLRDSRFPQDKAGRGSYATGQVDHAYVEPGLMLREKCEGWQGQRRGSHGGCFVQVWRHWIPEKLGRSKD